MLSQILRTQAFVPTFSRGLHLSAVRFSYPLSKSGKPLQPYMRFAAEKRPELLRQRPELTVPQQGSALGELWRNLSESERQRYKAEYEQAKK